MRRQAGFTLIELLVVMAIIASLLTIAVPRYFSSLEYSRETTLKQSLAVMRDALDQYYGDTGSSIRVNPACRRITTTPRTECR